MDTVLKMTGAELELLSEIGMYLNVEKGMRCGISNKYMKYYDDSKPSKCITYLEANSLYGWAIS